jgi:SulP family sulfate permease
MHPKDIDWFKEIFSGIYASFLIVCFTQAAVVLIFSGRLTPLLPFGLAGAFIGITIVNFFYGLNSRFRSSLTTTSPSLAGIAVLMIADVSSNTNPDQFLPTAMTALIIMSVSVGFAMLVTGMTGLVRLLRFMPYPVVGGFMAITGWSILVGSLLVMKQDLTMVPLTLEYLFTQNWLGILYGVLIFFAVNFIKNKYVYIVVLLSAILAVNLFVFFSGIDHQTAIKQGYYLTNMNISLMWQNWDVRYVEMINWQVIAKEINYYAAIAITAILIQTFRINTLEETSVSKNLLAREVSSCGVGVFISGLLGGILTTPSVPVSYLLEKFGVKTIIPTLISICSMVLLVTVAPNLISYVPKAVLVGLVIYSALELFYHWIIEAFWHFPFEDYVLVIVMVVISIIFGFMTSIMTGIIFAIVFFLIKYSRLDNIRYMLTGKEMRSKRKYPYLVEEYIRKEGTKNLVFKLQGYLFFGSSRNLIENIYYFIRKSPIGSYKNIIFDFQLITGVDSSSVKNFITIAGIAKRFEINTVISTCNEIILNRFKFLATEEWLNDNIKFTPSLDYAEEWCEKQLLSPELIQQSPDIDLFFSDPRKHVKFLSYMIKKKFKAKSYIFRQGEPSDSLFFIESGKVTGYITTKDEQQIRLFTSESSILVGEMGFFSGKRRRASVVAETPCVAYELTAENFLTLQRRNPKLVNEFYQAVINILIHRIRSLDRDLEIFQR